MTQEEMLTALYEKMAAEQDKYRDWLKRPACGGGPEPCLRVHGPGGHRDVHGGIGADRGPDKGALGFTHGRWPMFTRTLRSWKPVTWM